MGFASEMKRLADQLVQQQRTLFPNIVSAVKFSITDGSPITGSPGQPVDTAALKDSWQEQFEDSTHASVTTNLVYAPANEDGITDAGGPYVQRSPVGGRHSVKLTVAGFQAITNDEVRKLVNA